MTPRQLEAHKTGILAHATRLATQGIPFEDARVGQVLDAAILLKEQGVTDEERDEVYYAILQLYPQRPQTV
jgi:hypothetical protein